MSRSATYHAAAGSVAGCAAPRLTLAQAGDLLDADLRIAIERVLASLPQLPEPRMLASDIKRRPIGFRGAGQLLSACARDGAPLSGALAVAEAVHHFTLGLYGGDDRTVREAWAAETREQAEADVAQGIALLSQSETDLARAIEQTQQEIGAKRALLVCLNRALGRARASRLTARSA